VTDLVDGDTFDTIAHSPQRRANRGSLPQSRCGHRYRFGDAMAELWAATHNPIWMWLHIPRKLAAAAAGHGNARADMNRVAGPGLGSHRPFAPSVDSGSDTTLGRGSACCNPRLRIYHLRGICVRHPVGGTHCSGWSRSPEPARDSYNQDEHMTPCTEFYKFRG